jgi:hypothetical protein
VGLLQEAFSMTPCTASGFKRVAKGMRRKPWRRLVFHVEHSPPDHCSRLRHHASCKDQFERDVEFERSGMCKNRQSLPEWECSHSPRLDQWVQELDQQGGRTWTYVRLTAGFDFCRGVCELSIPPSTLYNGLDMTPFIHPPAPASSRQPINTPLTTTA